MLFQDFQDTFLEVCESRRNSAGEMAQKRLCLTNHLLPHFGTMALDAVGMPEIRRYIKEKLAEGYAEKTVNNHLVTLSRYLNVARDERALSAPAFKMQSIPLEFSEARFLTAAEIKRLLVAANGESDAMRAMIIVALNTGLRIGELLGLKWDAIDLRAKRLAVLKSYCRTSHKLKAPKNGKRRDVFLNAQAQAALVAMPERHGLVFDISYGGAYDALQRICEKAQIEDAGWHTLRHTFASLLALEGVPLFTVSRLLGHSSIRITERYAHLNDEKNKDAVACLAVAMGV